MPKVEIYTSTMCAYCLAAKNLLKRNGLDYIEIRVDTDPSRLQEMLSRTHQRSIPQVFIGSHHVGGYEQLLAVEQSGELTQIIRSAE